MRKHSKIVAAIAGASAAVVLSGVAYAYWTTSGSGTATGSTTAGTVNLLTYTQNPAGVPDTSVPLAAMYPGDSSQSLTVRVRNTSPTESAYVPSVKVWIDTDKSGCTATDFKLNGAPSTATSVATAQDLTWTAQDLAAQAAANATGSIQFNNKASNQDACKGAAVTLHYLTPATP